MGDDTVMIFNTHLQEVRIKFSLTTRLFKSIVQLKFVSDVPGRYVLACGLQIATEVILRRLFVTLRSLIWVSPPPTATVDMVYRWTLRYFKPAWASSRIQSKFVV